MIKRPESWLRFGFALTVFWATLCFADLLLSDAAIFNASLTGVAVAQGYISALRGLFLLLLLAVILTMAALLRRGLIIAPLIWIVQVGRLSYFGPWQDMVENLFFVSPTLNLVALVVLPPLISLLFWYGLELIDPKACLGKGLLPGLWLVLTLLVSAGNLFTWYWSLEFGLAVWPGGYGVAMMLAGVVLLTLTAGLHPWGSLAIFFGGLIVPTLACTAIWGSYDGLGLALLSFLPWCGEGPMQIWLGLMVIFGLPLLLVLAVNQYYTWRKGGKLLGFL